MVIGLGPLHVDKQRPAPSGPDVRLQVGQVSVAGKVFRWQIAGGGAEQIESHRQPGWRSGEKAKRTDDGRPGCSARRMMPVDLLRRRRASETGTRGSSPRCWLPVLSLQKYTPVMGAGEGKYVSSRRSLPEVCFSGEAKQSTAFIRRQSCVSLHISRLACAARSVQDQELQVDGMGNRIGCRARSSCGRMQIVDVARE